MGKRRSNPAYFAIVVTVFCVAVFAASLLFAPGAQAQITRLANDDGRTLFVNAEPPILLKIASRRRNSIFLPSEPSFTGKNRPAMNLDRDGAEKLVRPAAEGHSVDPALIAGGMKTESHWILWGFPGKGAVGLMPLIPPTARRFGVNHF